MALQGKQLKLSVPGLAEKRPSILKGDQIIVKMTIGNEQEFAGLNFTNIFRSSFLYRSGFFSDFTTYFKLAL